MTIEQAMQWQVFLLMLGVAMAGVVAIWLACMRIVDLVEDWFDCRRIAPRGCGHRLLCSRHGVRRAS